MKPQFTSFRIPFWKRSFDIVVSLVALILLSPLFLVVALAIKLESRGPVFYSSKRVGSSYRIFDFYKFRSMYINADQRIAELSKTQNQYSAPTASSGDVIYDYSQDIPEVSHSTMLVGDDTQIAEHVYVVERRNNSERAFVKVLADPRVTRVGRFIRKYSIDELAQLFNILRGDMSIVGNRPLPLYEAEKLTSDEYVERFLAPAGLTGLWQVERRGRYSTMSPEDRKMLDIEYARRFSFAMDMKIIFRTFTAFIQRENV